MKLAVIGSRNLTKAVIDGYISEEVDEIVSGGARGIDSLARDYAVRKGIRLTQILPKYEKYGRAAPLKRNEEIAKYADEAIAFWDGRSKGTQHTIESFKTLGKKITVIIVNDGD